MRCIRKYCSLSPIYLAWLITGGLCLASCSSKYVLDYSYVDSNGAPPSRPGNARIKLDASGAIIVVHVTNYIVRRTWDQFFYIPFDIRDSREVLVSPYYGPGRTGNDTLLSPDYFVIEILIDPSDLNVGIRPDEICIESTEKIRRTCPVAWLSPSEPSYTRDILSKLRDDRIWEVEGGFFQPLCINAFNLGKTELRGNKVVPITENNENFSKLGKGITIEVVPSNARCIALRYAIPPPDPHESFIVSFGRVSMNGKQIHVTPLVFKFATGTYSTW